MAQANLGRVRPIFKGTYNPLESYDLLDLVDYLGDLYSPKQPTTGNLPTDGLYWTLILKQYGDISTYQGSPRVYDLNEFTKEGDTIYVSQQANNSGVVPSTDTDYSHWKPYALTIATQSATDTTAGRLLKVGDFGVGAQLATNLTTTTNTFYSYSSGAGVGTGYGAGFQAAYAPNRRCQFFIDASGSAYFRWTQSTDVEDMVTPWKQLYHTGNLTISSTTVDMAGNGDFTGGTLYCERVGNNVTLTWLSLTHASSQSPAVTTGVPVGYRPLTTIATTFYYDDTKGRNALVNASGIFSLSFFDEAGGVSSTSTGGGSITYKVA